jgi:hypothetical protein
MSQIVGQVRLDANWRAITAELDAPKPSILERLLGRIGVPGHVTRVIVATPALRRAWYLALGVAVLVGLGAANPGDRSSLFTLLALAPTLPVLGVALAYGPAADPMYEAQLATPMRGLRLVAIRAVTVLCVAVVVLGVPSLLSPVARPMAFAWLLPAVALTSGSLALMTWLPPRRAAAVVAVVWFAGVVLIEGAGSTELTAFGPVGQVAALLVAVAAAVVVFTRRSSFDRMEHLG